MLRYANRSSANTGLPGDKKAGITSQISTSALAHLDLPGSPAKGALDRMGNKAGDLQLRKVVVHMTQRDPDNRHSVLEYRKQLELENSGGHDAPFPPFFNTALYPLFLRLHWEGTGPDQRIGILCEVGSRCIDLACPLLSSPILFPLLSFAQLSSPLLSSRLLSSRLLCFYFSCSPLPFFLLLSSPLLSFLICSLFFSSPTLSFPFFSSALLSSLLLSFLLVSSPLLSFLLLSSPFLSSPLLFFPPFLCFLLLSSLFLSYPFLSFPLLSVLLLSSSFLFKPLTSMY